MSDTATLRQRLGLLSWPLDLFAGLVLAICVCLMPGVLNPKTQLLIPALIAVWLAVNSWDLGRHGLISRIVRTVLRVLLVAGPPMAAIWLGIRSFVQDSMLHNRLFPLLKMDEMGVPKAWLPAIIALLVLLPLVTALGRKGVLGTLAAIVLALFIGGGAVGGGYLALQPKKPAPPGKATHTKPTQPKYTSVTFHFQLANSLMKDVELDVNGVNLGTLPITISDKDFYAKVPPRQPGPPRGTGRVIQPLLLPVMNADPGLFPKTVRACDLQMGMLAGGQYAPDRYRAMCRYHGTWAYFTSLGSNNATGDKEGHWDVYKTLYTGLPGRDAVIRQYVDYAQVHDCKVPDEWYDDIAPLFPEIGLRLYRDIQDPEQLQRLREGWANHRYHIDKVDSPQAAWDVLEKIAADVKEFSPTYDSGAFYDSPMELLAPKLDIDQLLDAACEYLDEWRTNPVRSQFTFYFSHGRIQFIVGYFDGNRSYPRDPLTSPMPVYTSGKEQPPDRAWVIAHALLARHYQYLREGAPYPSPIQARLTPALLRYDYAQHVGLLGAAFLGGPDADKYLLRGPWLVPYEKLPEADRKQVYGKASRYQLAVAWLQTEAGARAREEHPEVYQPMLEHVSGRTMQPWEQFIALDGQPLDDWWYKLVRVRDSAGHLPPISRMWGSLLRTGDFATPDRFLQASVYWPRDTSDLYESMKLFDQMPADRREAAGKDILQQLTIFFPERDEAIKKAGLTTEDVREQFKQAMAGTWQAHKWLHSFDAQRVPKMGADKLQVWLEDNAPSPLIPVLATSDKPEHRWFAVAGIQASPSAEYRKLLDTLARDPDLNVRLRAVRARKQIAEFAKLKPSEVPDYFCPPAPWYLQ